MMMMLVTLFFLLVAAVTVTATAVTATSTTATVAALKAKEHVHLSRLGLGKSTWPTDHGDVARSKFTMDYGLPANFDAEKLTMQVETSLPNAQWIYTYGDNSEYLFLISWIRSNASSGEQPEFSIQKVDSKSLETLQTFFLGGAIYLGGLLIHENGHVYCVHSNVLHKFENGDLTKVTSKRLPTQLNDRLVCTNGMLVTSDGYLVIKQWNFLFEDAVVFNIFSNRTSFRVALTVWIVSLVGFFMILRTRNKKQAGKDQISIPRMLTRLLGSFFSASVMTTILVMALVVLSMKKRVGSFDAVLFLGTNLFFGSNGGGGELKIIDPLSLNVVADYTLPERCSFARMSMFPIHTSTYSTTSTTSATTAATIGKEAVIEDAIVLLGDTHVYQLRWHHSSASLRLLTTWTRKYRGVRDGTLPGTGPAIYNNSVYFTDNTFGGALYGHSFKLFEVPLLENTALLPSDAASTSSSSSSSSLVACSGFDRDVPKCPFARYVSLTDNDAGFFFFSSVISPLVGDVLVWNTGGANVQARDLHSLQLHWKVDMRNADCVNVAANQGHVYATDYSSAPTSSNAWMTEIVSKSKELVFTNISKFFVVLDAKTGNVLANKTIATNDKIFVSMIIPGGNRDVFFGSSKGLVRMYIAE